MLSSPSLTAKVIITFCVLLLAATPNHGQGVPWYTIPLPLPNGFLDVATGNVHLEIPLASISERNGDPLVSKAVYDGTAYSYNGGWGQNGPGWQVFTGNSHSGWGSYNSSYQDCSGYSPYTSGQVTTNYFYFVDNHSTSHVLNNLYHTYQVNCYDPTTGIYFGSGSDIPSTSGSAWDGSGYTFTVTNYTALRVNAPDGTLVSGNANAPVDTNGNYSRYSVGSQPDMLGRSPLQFQPYPFISICPSSSSSIGIRASDGSTNTYTFTCTSYSVSQVVFGTTYTTMESFLTSIALPDGTQYSFAYDTGTSGNHVGDLLSITLPSGGVVSFSPAVYPRTVAFGGGTWNLNGVYNSSTRQTTTTVMSPLRYDSSSGTNVSDKTVFVSVPSHAYVQTAQYYSGSSTLLRTVTTTYDNSGIYYVPMTVTTTLNDTGQSSSVAYQYYNNLMRNYPTQKQETDFTGAVVRTTKFIYNPSFMKPTSVNVYAGSGTGSPIASTLFTYDEYTANYCKNGVPMLTNVTGATGHDDTNYGISYTARGNVTTIQRLISGTTYSTTHMCYDTLGNVTQTVDANGNPTSYDYSENWADASCIPTGTVTHAFPTTITDALGHRAKKSYFTCTSLTQSVKDENDIQAGRSGTTFTYDLFQRPLTINYPDGGQTTNCYSHNSNLPCYTTTLPPFSTESRLISGSTTMNTKTLLDSYGRVVETQLTSDPDCSSGDKTDTSYDVFGRVQSVSNPYCTTSDPSYGITTYNYDALGRTTQVTNPDNSTVLTTHTGRATQVQDQGNGTQRVQRISQTDALGRLVSLCEVSSASLIGSGGTPGACGQDIAGTGFLTSYQYDALDNLTTVSMSGLNPRTFAYDSLSRLTRATNPESGQICYGTVSGGACQANGYDANSNLVTKTDARGIRTTYSYDALNRLTGKTYSDGAPAATFNYDQSSALGVTLANTKGRKSSQSTAGPNATGSVFSYDQMGRVANNSQCTPQNCGTAVFGFQYTQYDFVGDLVSATNAVGVTFNYAYNGVARLTGITTNFIDGSHPGTLFSSAHYSPFGALTGGTLGNGVIESWSYNKRLWQQSRTATFGATTPYSFSVPTFAPNGDILAANDSANGNWTYTYDTFNRLLSSNTSGQAYTYDYDRFGNRWHQNGPHSSQLGFDANNRITGVTGVGYDLAGNLTSDGSGPGSHIYFYDAENRLIQVDGTLGTCSTATACYVYNADGQRVRKTTGGSSMDYLYDLAGHKIADVDPTGVFMRGELYAGGRHFAVYAPEPGPTGATFFTHSDWLGTERVRTDMTGAPCETITSLAFGDGQIISGNCGNSSGDVSPMHFTGKERDTESGLDNFGARFDSSSMGRFMSPDPENAGASLGAPQSWNAYTYVFNNPLKYVDPDGLACVYLNNAGSKVDHILPEDCANEGGKDDAGYFVDNDERHPVQTSDITIEGDKMVVSFSSQNDLPGQGHYQQFCTGYCPDNSVTVSTSIGDPIPTTMSAPHSGLPPANLQKYEPPVQADFWNMTPQQQTNVSTCMATGGEYGGESIEPPDAGQAIAQVHSSDGRPAQYPGNNKRVIPNIKGAKRTPRATGSSGAFEFISGGLNCTVHVLANQ